jgi:hypothetical protein
MIKASLCKKISNSEAKTKKKADYLSEYPGPTHSVQSLCVQSHFFVVGHSWFGRRIHCRFILDRFGVPYAQNGLF